ncbi:MAG TPA: hypothetical protein VG649_04575 [Candidatus Angelobacter sp.]|nr:hypothetical protein [Candidatus Angelobacter sp.]
MELVLNFVWLGISCVLLVLGIPLILSQRLACSRWSAAVALVCILCLLFPVISMTDDLHNTPAVVENKKLKKLVVAAHVLAALLSSFLFQAPEPVAVAAKDRDELCFPIAVMFTLDLSRRPPPALRASLFV